MNLKKIITWAFAIGFAWFVITQPAAAGQFVHNGIEFLKHAGSAFNTFFNNI